MAKAFRWRYDMRLEHRIADRRAVVKLAGFDDLSNCTEPL